MSAPVPVVAALSGGKYVWSINRAWLVIESKSAHVVRTVRSAAASCTRDHLGHRSLPCISSSSSSSSHTAAITATAVTSSASFHSFIPNGSADRVVRPGATTHILYCAELRNVMLESCTYGRSCEQFAVHKFLPRINHNCDLHREERCAF